MMRAIISVLIVFLSALTVAAQKASFIYIQGDKKTPFYVKLEGEMQPRYGKNYCIIPELTAGVANIEVLFQQNAFPAQKFAIKIPDGGARGLLIVEKGGAISLYDLEQEFYLAAGNKAEDDRLPALIATSSPVLSQPISIARPADGEEPRIAASRTRPTVAERRRNPRLSPAATPTSENPSGPRFIPNLSLDTAGARTGGLALGDGCGEAMDVQSFATLYRSVLDIADQDERLVFLNKQTDGCYSPTQLRLLARVLDRDAARFTFLRKFQSRITAAARFAELEDVLTAEAYRTRFRELL